MAFMQMEASALLVRKESLDPETFLIPITDFFFQVEIGDKINLVFVPPGNDQHWPIALPSKGYLFGTQAHAWLEKPILKGKLFTIVQNRVAGGTTSILPAKFSQFLL